ncbi:hypothetical protein GCM10011504_47810 [Siccirubricoccus deserti]|nr:hypothetical protein GCM10011504_47810 [Siccirubricoccus deserti]
MHGGDVDGAFGIATCSHRGTRGGYDLHSHRIHVSEGGCNSGLNLPIEFLERRPEERLLP